MTSRTVAQLFPFLIAPGGEAGQLQQSHAVKHIKTRKARQLQLSDPFAPWFGR